MNPNLWAIAPRYLIDAMSGRDGWTMIAFGSRGECIILCSHSHTAPHEAANCPEFRNAMETFEPGNIQAKKEAALNRLSRAIDAEQMAELERCFTAEADSFPGDEV